MRHWEIEVDQKRCRPCVFCRSEYGEPVASIRQDGDVPCEIAGNTIYLCSDCAPTLAAMLAGSAIYHAWEGGFEDHYALVEAANAALAKHESVFWKNVTRHLAWCADHTQRTLKEEMAKGKPDDDEPTNTNTPDQESNDAGRL